MLRAATALVGRSAFAARRLPVVRSAVLFSTTRRAAALDPSVAAALDAAFMPRGIAVVGASSRPGSVGLAVMKNLLRGEYAGAIYPVNPRATSVQGIPAYASVRDLAGRDIDLAVVIVKADLVPEVVADAGRCGIKAAIVITAGFKEIGGAGVEAEKQLRRLAHENNIRLIGPNCLGIINPHPGTSMNASFSRNMPKAGNIGFMSQSGALCTSVLDYAQGRNISFSRFVSFGNKADINEIELLEYLGQDPDTRVIAVYLEDITDGRKFLDVARRITLEQGKPILAIKSGRSAEGARAAASHTGSLAGSDKAYDALFKQSGVIRCDTIHELFDLAEAFSMQETDMVVGDRIAVVTNAGGPGIMATDAIIREGMRLATFSDATLEHLRATLPSTAAIHNPVDVIGDATHTRYESAVQAVLEDEGVDGCLVCLTPQMMTDIIETARIVPTARDRAIKSTGKVKPTLCSFMGLVDVSEGGKYLEDHGIPNFSFPEEAVQTLKAMVQYGNVRKHAELEPVHFQDVDRAAAAGLIAAALERNGGEHAYLSQFEADKILRCYGLPTQKNALVTSADEAQSVAGRLQAPFVMKIMSADIIHKREAGGVLLNVSSPQEAREGYETMLARVKRSHPDAKIDGVLVQEMAPSGFELIIGAARDPQFGPMVIFGLGGSLVEMVGDVSFRLAPMTHRCATQMMLESKSYQRFVKKLGDDSDKVERQLCDIILRLSTLVSDHPEIVECDMNPVIIGADVHGAAVADSRISLRVTPAQKQEK